MKSITYWHRLIYTSLMRLTYGRKFKRRYEVLNGLLERDHSLLELCSGDCYLYLNFLIQKGIRYTGVDINKSFVNYARRNSVNVEILNVLYDEIPEEDTILMHASLYQFIPNEKRIIDKIIAAAKEKVIIAEPVMNRSHSANKFTRILSAFLSNPGTKRAKKRFSPEDFEKLCCSYPEFSHFVGNINETNEMIAVFKSNCH